MRGRRFDGDRDEAGRRRDNEMGEEEKVFNGMMSAATKLVAEQCGNVSDILD